MGYTQESIDHTYKNIFATLQPDREGASVPGPKFVKVSEAAAELPHAFKQVLNSDNTSPISPTMAVRGLKGPVMVSRPNKDFLPTMIHPMEEFSFPSPPQDDAKASTSEEQDTKLDTSIHRAGGSLGQQNDFDPELWSLASKELAAIAAQQQLKSNQDHEQEIQALVQQLATSQAVSQSLRQDLEQKDLSLASLRREMASMERERDMVADDHIKLHKIIDELQNSNDKVRNQITSVSAQYEGQLEMLTQTCKQISDDYVRVCEDMALLRNADHVKLSGDLAQQVRDQKHALDNANAKAAFWEATLQQEVKHWSEKTTAFERKTAKDAATIRELIREFEKQLALSATTQKTADGLHKENLALVEELKVLNKRIEDDDKTFAGIAKGVHLENLQLPVHCRNKVKQPKLVRTNRVRSLRNALKMAQKQHQDEVEHNKSTHEKLEAANKKVRDLEGQVQQLQDANAEVMELFNVTRDSTIDFVNGAGALIARGQVEGLAHDVTEAGRRQQATIDAMEKSARDITRLRDQILGLERKHEGETTALNERISELELDNRRLDAEQFKAVCQGVDDKKATDQFEAEKKHLQEYVNLLESQAFGDRAETARTRFADKIAQLEGERNALIWRVGNSWTQAYEAKMDRELCLENMGYEFFVIRDLAAQRDYLYNVVSALRERFADNLRAAPQDLKPFLPEFAIKTRQEQEEVLDDERRIVFAWDRATAIDRLFPIRLGDVWGQVCRLSGVVRAEWGWGADNDNGNEGPFAWERTGNNNSSENSAAGSGPEQGSEESEEDLAGWEDASSDEDSEGEPDDSNHAWPWEQ